MHFDFLRKYLLMLVLICLLFQTQSAFAEDELSPADDHFSWGESCFMLEMPLQHQTVTYLREEAMSADESNVYKILGSPLNSNQIQSPYYVHRFDLAGMTETGVLQIDGFPGGFSFGPYQQSLTGKDLQDRYLYFICNGNTALIDKDSFSVEAIVPHEFGQSNYVKDERIFTFRPTGIYLYENGGMSLFENAEIVVDKESSIRRIAGEIVFLARKDGVLKAGLFDPENESIRYVTLEDVPGALVNDPASKNYLLGISPTGDITAATRNPGCMCFVRSWNVLGALLNGDDAAALLRSFYFQQDTNYASSSSSGAYPVFDHYLNINYVYTSSYNKSTGVVTVTVYPMDDPASGQQQTFGANRKIPTVKWDGAVFGLEMQDGFVYIHFAMNRVDLPTRTKVFDFSGMAQDSSVTHTAELSKYAGLIKYGYRLNSCYILSSYDAAGGAGQYYAFKAPFKTIIAEIEKPAQEDPALPEEPETPEDPDPGQNGEGNGDGGDDDGNGSGGGDAGGGSGNGNGSNDNEDGDENAGGAVRRYRLHRVY